MAKKKKEKVVEKTTKANEPKGDVTKVKEKMTMKPKVIEETITKVDLDKPPKTETDAVHGTTTESVQSTGSESEEGGEETKVEVSQSDTVQDETVPVIEEVTNEEEVAEKVDEVAEKVEEAIVESQQTGEPLPENIQKLVNFMEETGGDLHDYVNLNKDYGKLDNQDLLLEYYRQTKPHLNQEEISFLMEDQFSYDEEVDEEKDIKRKKLALKEQVANAKTQLEENKSKYYEDIKAGSKLTQDQQDAIDFYNGYKTESDKLQVEQETANSIFSKKTSEVFSDKFKGFEYNIGDRKFRFNVNDINSTKKTQSDLNNFIGKFLNKDRLMEDAKGYHKGLFTAMNPDMVANHFYEQGKADALRESVAKSKNIDMTPRQELDENIDTGDIKVKVLGDTTPDFKFKIKNK